MLLLVAAVAAHPGRCSVQVRADVHVTRCRVAGDEGSIAATPVGARALAPDKLAVTLEVVTPGYATSRSLTSGGINSATGDLLRERNAACWTAPGRRLCLGRAVPRRVRARRAVPAAYRGAWGVDEPAGEGARVTLAADQVVDADGRGWVVTQVADSDGVLLIRGLALDDGTTRGNWTVALAPDGGLLLLGSPDRLARLDAPRAGTPPAGWVGARRAAWPSGGQDHRHHRRPAT